MKIAATSGLSFELLPSAELADVDAILAKLYK
jgi:hypothetical protein